MFIITRTRLIIGGLVALLIIVTITAGIISNNQKNNDQGISTTTVSSPFTHSTTAVVPYYKGDRDSGDSDIVNTQFTTFTADKLKVSDDIKSALKYGVPEFLQSYEPPNVETVFVQLDVDSVKYTSSNNYSFDFYVDSPEGYFSYTVTPRDNNQSTTTITPIAGGWL